MSAALIAKAAASHGAERFPFALALDWLAPQTATRGAPVVALEAIAANQLVMTPHVMLDVFTPEECARIVAHGSAGPLLEGQVNQQRPGYRTATAAWLAPHPATLFAYERIAALVKRINAWYRYELFGFFEPLHFIRYGSGGKFDWHLDCGGDDTVTRKLSVTVQLTDPAAYEGGALEFCPQGELPRCRYQGAATVFPSVLAHRVTPVSRGVRHAIVAWIHGPSFR